VLASGAFVLELVLAALGAVALVSVALSSGALSSGALSSGALCRIERLMCRAPYVSTLCVERFMCALCAPCAPCVLCIGALMWLNLSSVCVAHVFCRVAHKSFSV